MFLSPETQRGRQINRETSEGIQTGFRTTWPPFSRDKNPHAAIECPLKLTLVFLRIKKWF